MHPEMDDALCRSAVYAALALGLGPPGPEVEERLASAEGSRRFEELLALVDLDAPAVSAAPLLPRYQELFGHTVRGRVSPYETEYGGHGNLFSQARELADIGAFFSALGLRLPPDRHERADHVRCECELMAFLASKEAYAIESGDASMLDATRDAERAFLRDHLGRFAAAFGSALAREDGAGFYGRLGALLNALVARECARLGVAAGGEELSLRLPVVEDVPAACGNCEAAEGCEA